MSTTLDPLNHPTPGPNSPKTVAEDAERTGAPFDIAARNWASRAATRFALVVRRAGSLAWAVRVGSEVQVTGGTRVPHGYYRVVERSLYGGVLKLSIVDPFSTARNPHQHVIVWGSSDTRVVPAWAAAFSGAGDIGPVLAGACKAGLGPLEWAMIADWFEDDPARASAVPCLVADAIVPGVPLDYVWESLRTRIASDTNLHGVPPETQESWLVSMEPDPALSWRPTRRRKGGRDRHGRPIQGS